MIKCDFKDKSVYNQEQIIGHEKDKEMIFEWIDVNKLEELDFKPVEVIPYLKNIDGKVHHMIIK